MFADIRHDRSRRLLNFSFSLLPPPKTSSHHQTISHNKMSDMQRLIVGRLREQSQTLPGPPAEKSNYEVWARGFLKLLVSCRKSNSPPTDTSIGNLRWALERCDQRDGRSNGQRGYQGPRGGRGRIVGPMGGSSHSQRSTSSQGSGGGEVSRGA